MKKTMILSDSLPYKYFSLSYIFPYWSMFRFLAIFIRKIGEMWKYKVIEEGLRGPDQS